MMFCGTSTARAVGATPPSKPRMCLTVALGAKSWPAARSSQTIAILASLNLQASWARGEDLMKSESVVYFYFFHLVTVGSWCALQLFLLFHSLKPLSLSLCSNRDLLQVAKRLFCSSDKGHYQKGCSFALGGLHFSSCRPPTFCLCFAPLADLHSHFHQEKACHQFSARTVCLPSPGTL